MAFESVKYLSDGDDGLRMLKDMGEAGGNPGDCPGYCNLEAPALCARFSWGRSEMVLVSPYEGLRVERHALLV